MFSGLMSLTSRQAVITMEQIGSRGLGVGIGEGAGSMANAVPLRPPTLGRTTGVLHEQRARTSALSAPVRHAAGVEVQQHRQQRVDHHLPGRGGREMRPPSLANRDARLPER